MMRILPEKEFVGSRGKTSVVFFISLALVAIAFLLPGNSGLSDFGRAMGVAFFGLCLLVFSCLLVRPQRLFLDTEGFTMSGGLIWSPKRIGWRDTNSFHLHRLPNGRKIVAFRYRSGAHDSSALVKFNRRSAGVDGALPGFWRVAPEKLVEELNAYRELALAR